MVMIIIKMTSLPPPVGTRVGAGTEMRMRSGILAGGDHNDDHDGGEENDHDDGEKSDGEGGDSDHDDGEGDHDDHDDDHDDGGDGDHDDQDQRGFAWKMQSKVLAGADLAPGTTTRENIIRKKR